MSTRDTDETRILNYRQMQFVYLWKGDAIEAAAAAGYRDPKSAAYYLMQQEIICNLIRKKQEKIAEEAGKALGKQLSFYRTDVINRLWELAQLPPSKTGETITGQIRAAEALAEILAVEKHVDADNLALVKQLEAQKTAAVEVPANSEASDSVPELPAPPANAEPATATAEIQ